MKALFDLSFRTFVAPTIAKVVYVIGMIVIALTFLAAVVSAFDEDVLLGLLVLLIVGPIVGLFYLVFLRVGLESLLATIFTAQNTSRLIDVLGGQPGGGASGFGPPTAGPGGPWTSGPPPQQPSGPPPSQQPSSGPSPQPGAPPPPQSPPQSPSTPPPPPPSSGPSGQSGQAPPPPPPPRGGPEGEG